MLSSSLPPNTILSLSLPKPFSWVNNKLHAIFFLYFCQVIIFLSRLDYKLYEDGKGKITEKRKGVEHLLCTEKINDNKINIY